MSVIIRLQNLPWSANALDIRNFFRGLSIPEGGVHIVGGELGDAFIAFSTDEDARQAMMLDCGKIKEIQVRLLLSSRSEMHKVIEAARQIVPIMTLAAPAPAPAPVVPAPAPAPPPAPSPAPPAPQPFAAMLASAGLAPFGIPGLGNPQEIPQPAVIEPPAPHVISSPLVIDDDDKSERRRSKERERKRTKSRSKSRSRSRERDRKDRKRDRRDRSRSRDRRRRDRSRSRDRRKRDRKDRSRTRSPTRRSRDRRDRSPDKPFDPHAPDFSNASLPGRMPANNGQSGQSPRFPEADAFNKIEEIGKKRNANAFQGVQNGLPRGGRGGRGGGVPARRSRFEDPAGDCCVAIRDAPTHTSYGDVRRFFPFMIDKHGIKMINDPSGRRTGTIYVRFMDTRSRQLALQRPPAELKGAPVQVAALDDAAYDAAVDSFMPFRDAAPPPPPAAPAPAPFTTLRLRELPHYFQEHDVMKMFSEFPLLSIALEDCKESRSRTARVQFAREEDARVVFERREQYVFGRRSVVVTIDREEPREVSREAPRDPRRRQPPAGLLSAQEFAFPAGPPQVPEDDGAPDCVLMKGLGPLATDRSIVSFLADTRAVPARIHLMLDAAGCPTGDCFCEFRSAQEARQAATKHGSELSGNRVSVDLVPRGVVMAALETPAAAPSSPPQAPQAPQASQPPIPQLMPQFQDPRQAPFRAPFHPRGAFRGGFDQRAPNGFDPPPQNQNFDQFEEPPQNFEQKPTGNGNNRSNFERSRGFDGPPGGFDPPQGRGGFDQGPPMGRGGFNQNQSGRGGFEQSSRGGGYRGRGWSDRSRGRGRGRGRGSFDNNTRQPAPEADADNALDGFGAPGCVVGMENVPFRAAVDDILDFFSEFELSQDDIIRRYNERGQPTGDARVAFRTPFDAQRAVKTRHMDMIHERRITLTLV